MVKSFAKTATSMAKVVFENDRVRIVELRMKKGEKIAEHEHGPYFAYAVTPFNYKSITAGKAVKYNVKKGKVQWSDGETHAVEALATGRALVVELK